MTEITDNIDGTTGWVLYDGGCAACSGMAARFSPWLARRRFRLAPLETPQSVRLLGPHGADEMKLVTRDGRILGGADAFLHLVALVPWLGPICALARLPGARVCLRSIYRQIAARRSCLARGACRT